MPFVPIIYTSPFLRTAQTAHIAAATFGCSQIITSKLLYERGFGELNLASSSLYEKIWASYMKSSKSTLFWSESLNMVAKRLSRLISILEKKICK